uniref:Uncharacterized protein n=1 Tax=Romanomermis culicivorax TaxID=13658 RepID=A0A915JWV0_ROMCU
MVDHQADSNREVDMGGRCTSGQTKSDAGLKFKTWDVYLSQGKLEKLMRMVDQSCGKPGWNSNCWMEEYHMD